MKRILGLIAILILITGCEITGRVVQEVENQTTQADRDIDNLEKAVKEDDLALCYKIQNQQIREDCFIQMAQLRENPSICNNLLGNSFREQCRESINT